jgi:hypothetical protein
MALRTSASVLLLCGLLGACAGEQKQKADAGLNGEDLDAAAMDGGLPIAVGDPVDVDNDGKTDGEAVDTNNDGVPDGVDTDGDGDVDEPLPPGSVPVDADGSVVNMDAAVGNADGSATQGDGGVLIVADTGASPFPVDDAGQVLCGTGPCACSNGKDDDMDGLSDLADPECVSPWDNDEASFATGISGDNRDDACQDCFFDGNSGSGNDGCRLPSSCLTEGNPSSGQGSCNKCEQTAQCKNFCKAYTPNGCDCFGCCSVRLANGTNVNVALGNGCNIDGNTVTGCNTCVPNDSCRNECGKCELCPGKTVADLPAECFQTPPSDGGTTGNPDGGSTGTPDGGSSDPDSGTVLEGQGDAGTPPPPPPVYTCDDGAQVCGAGLPGCATGQACSFGCCVLIPIILF